MKSNRIWIVAGLVALGICSALIGVIVNSGGSSAESVTSEDSGQAVAGKPVPLCGHLCVFRVCQLYGVSVQLSDLMTRMPAENGSHSLLDLATELTAIGLDCKGEKQKLEELDTTNQCYIAALHSPEHFIVIHSIDDRGVHVFGDDGRRTLVSASDIRSRWRDAVLAVQREDETVLPAYYPLLSGKPRIQFQKLYHDRGSIPYTGGRVDFHFKFRNAGDADLVIGDVEVTCKCLKTVCNEHTIPPGEEGEITLVYSPEDQRGTFFQQALVKTNDPLDERLFLSTAGVVYAGIWGSPAIVNFPTVPAGQVRSQLFYIGYTSELADFQIENVHSTLDDLTARRTKWNPDDLVKRITQDLGPVPELQHISRPPEYEVLELTFAPKPDSLQGPLEGELVVETSVPEFKEMHFPVRVRVGRFLESYPETISFGQLEPGDGKVSRTIRLRHPEGVSFEIMSAKPETFEIVHSSIDSGEVDLTVTATAEHLLELEPKTELSLEVDCRGEKQLLILPVYAWPRFSGVSPESEVKSESL